MHPFYLSYLKSFVNVCTTETTNHSRNTECSDTSPPQVSSYWFLILHYRDQL